MLRERTTLAIWILAVCLAPAISQERPPQLPTVEVPNARIGQTDTLTQEAIAEQRKALESAELDEAVRKQGLDLLAQADSELKRATQFAASATSDRQRVQDAESTADSLQQDITFQKTAPDDDLGEYWDLERLQTEVLTRTTKLDGLKRQLEQLEEQNRARDDRREKLSAAQTSLRSRRDEAQQQLGQDPPEGEDARVSNARRLLAQARLRALNSEEPAIAAELARMTAEESSQLMRRRIEFTRREATLYEAEIKELQKQQDQKRRTEAADTKDSLNDIPEGPELKQAEEWVSENDSLVSSLIPTATRLASTREQQHEEDGKTETRIRDRVELLGVVAPVGMELQEQLTKLRDISVMKGDVEDREMTLVELKFNHDSHEQALTELQRRLEKDPDNLVLQRRVSILETLVRNEATYIESLRSVDTWERRLIQSQERFRDWLNERVLWIRSNKVLQLKDIQASGHSLAWFLSPIQWVTLPTAVIADVRANFFVWGAALVLFVVLFLVRPRCRLDLMVAGKDAGRVSCARFGPTVRALWLTVLLASFWPMLIGFVGYRLTEPPRGSDFSQAIGHGLEGVAVSFLLVNLLRLICRNDGLGDAHFSWDNSAIRRLRRELRLVMIVLLPILFLATVFHSSREAPGSDSLERVLYVVGLVGLAWFAYRILNPKHGVFSEALAADQKGWGNRTRWLWYPLSIGVPVALALLAAAGYFFTAYELNWRLAGMIWLAVGLLLLQALLIRWYTVNQRRIRLSQAVQRQRAMLKQDAEAAAQVEEASQELVVVGEQTRRLINTGLLLTALVATWLIWSQVLPAVSFLNRWELWKTTREVSVERVVDGTPKLLTETVLEPITLLSLLKAVFIALATITAARNLPGLLEIILLKRLPLEPALRYAFRTVARYLLVIVGTTLTFNAIGFGWDKAQWLVAGLTVGLGFGLQEIFANFVSGLIILFERPVRLGDVVTIDDVTGNVTRIQIRATTVTDWENKEYIVPNKELVTGRLLNWTLTDKTSRILIEVGVAYGTGTKRARELLVECAYAHPLILNEPPPLATFEKFGDSALLLVLRCYLPNLDKRLTTASELYELIDQAFAEAEIEIAFPQLDVNLSEPSVPS